MYALARMYQELNELDHVLSVFFERLLILLQDTSSELQLPEAAKILGAMRYGSAATSSATIVTHFA